MITQVTYERVFNLGSYESGRISATVTVDGALEAAYDEARIAVALEHARTLAAREQAAAPNGGATYAEPPASPKQMNYIATLQDKLGWTGEQYCAHVEKLGYEPTRLNKTQASALINDLKRLADDDLF